MDATVNGWTLREKRCQSLTEPVEGHSLSPKMHPTTAHLAAEKMRAAEEMRLMRAAVAKMRAAVAAAERHRRPASIFTTSLNIGILQGQMKYSERRCHCRRTRTSPNRGVITLLLLCSFTSMPLPRSFRSSTINYMLDGLLILRGQCLQPTWTGLHYTATAPMMRTSRKSTNFQVCSVLCVVRRGT
jgi:hypothetical protein